MWLEKKFINIADYRNGKAHEKYIDDKGKFIVVNSKFISTEGEVCKNTNKNLEPLFKDEITMVLSDVPNGRAIAKTYFIDQDNTYSLNQRIAAIKPISVEPYFLYLILNRHPYFLKFDDGVGQTNLSRGDVESFIEKYPKSEEQKTITKLFVILEKRIDIEKIKLKKTKNIKNAYLEELFVSEEF